MNLHEKVIAWAEPKGLLIKSEERIEAQTLKFFEELGETAGAILRNDKLSITDGFGDIAVTLIILNDLEGFDIMLIDRVTFYGDAKINFKDIVRFLNTPTMAIAHLKGYMAQLGYDYDFCLSCAYEEIKNRKGKTINNNFVKDEDLTKDQ